MQIVDLYDLSRKSYPLIPKGMLGLRIPNLQGNYFQNGVDDSIVIALFPVPIYPQLYVFEISDNSELQNKHLITDEQLDLVYNRRTELKEYGKENIESQYMMSPHHQHSMEESHWVLWEDNCNLFMGIDPLSDPYLPRIYRTFGKIKLDNIV